MKRLALVAVALGCAAACGPKKAQGQLTTAEVGAMNADLMSSMRAMEQARSRTEMECGALEGRPVARSEERVFGERAAATWGAFWLDPEGAKGDRWAINQYVQIVGLHLTRGTTRKDGPWTFGVLDAAAPFAVSEMDGYVFVSSGLLAKLENEAQLAAALAHEIAHVANTAPVRGYAKARSTACRMALQGYYLVEASAGTTPGGEEFVKNAKFGKTMRHFATTDPLDVETDPEIDHEFVRWYLSRISEFQRLVGPQPAEEEDADKLAVKLLAGAGYDWSALAKVIPLVDPRSGAERLAKLAAAGGKTTSGKSPPFPNHLKWPQ